MNFDTSSTSRNNFSGIVGLGHNATGDYSLQWPGLERISGSSLSGGPEDSQVTAVGTGPERCRVANVDSQHAGVNVTCTTTGGALADSRFSAMWLTRGRPAPQYRFGYALAERVASTVDYTPNESYWRNNSGGTVTARQLTVGQYRVVFAGLGKAAGAKETVLITPGPGDDRICTTTSWGNTGVNDLAVMVSCFTPAGAPASAQFFEGSRSEM